MSLPQIFATRLETIPAAIPYLHADPDLVSAWRDELAARGALRVGLAWSGNAHYKSDAERSAPLDALAPPAGNELICVQKDLRDTDATAVAALGVRNLSEWLADSGKPPR